MSANPARRCAAVSIVGLFGLLLAGCSGPLRPDHEESVESGLIDQIKVDVIDEAAFGKVLERGRGKVVLVDFWATWCGPCKELFPHTVELHEQFADQGLVVISVSLDDPDDDRPRVLEFLSGESAVFDNFISRYGTGTQSAEAFGLDGPLPQLNLYDRQGKLHESFGGNRGPVDPHEVNQAVEELLAKT